MQELLNEKIDVWLPTEMAARTLRLARGLDISESELIRRALIAYMDGLLPIARTSEAQDERALRIRAYLGKVLARARTWRDVQALLGRQGMTYVPRGGGLVVVASETGETLCKASEVGPPYRQLVRCFGHFPGHPHVHIARKVAEEEPSLIDLED